MLEAAHAVGASRAGDKPARKLSGEVGGHDLDPRQPLGVGGGEPSPQVSCAVPLDHVDHDAALQVDQAGRVDRRVMPVGGRVMTAWRSTTGDVSVHVLASHNASRHRHRRLCHTSRAGRPKHGRSRTSTRIQSCAVARVPHRSQPTRSAVVSTTTTTSSAVSRTSSTRNPQHGLGEASTFTHAGVPPSLLPSDSRDDGEAPASRVGSPQPTPIPTPTRRASNPAVTSRRGSAECQRS